MSYNTKSNNTKSNNTKSNNTKSNNTKSNNFNVVKKPYCKVCHDAGKEESIYTSHYVKSEPGPKGKVVCPTLLEQLCNCCLKQGHTISYCPEVKKQNKIEKKDNYHKELLSKNIPIPVLKKNNRFELLNLEEYVKNKNTKNVKEEFPALTSTKKPITNVNSWCNNLPLMSYASIAKNAHEEAVKEEILIEIYKPKEEIKKPIILVKKRKPIKKSTPVKKSWAEYDDDDEDDEEDEDEYEYEEFVHNVIAIEEGFDEVFEY
jgi:hypothetical protein